MKKLIKIILIMLIISTRLFGMNKEGSASSSPSGPATVSPAVDGLGEAVATLRIHIEDNDNNIEETKSAKKLNPCDADYDPNDYCDDDLESSVRFNYAAHPKYNVSTHRAFCHINVYLNSIASKPDSISAQLMSLVQHVPTCPECKDVITPEIILLSLIDHKHQIIVD